MKYLKGYKIFETSKNILEKINSIKQFIINTDDLSDLRKELSKYKQNLDEYEMYLLPDIIKMVRLKWETSGNLLKSYKNNREKINNEILNMPYDDTTLEDEIQAKHIKNVEQKMKNYDVYDGYTIDDFYDSIDDFSSDGDIIYDENKSENIYLMGFMWDKTHELKDDEYSLRVKWLKDKVDTDYIETLGSLRVVNEDYLNKNKDKFNHDLEFAGVTIIKLYNFNGEIILSGSNFGGGILIVDGTFTKSDNIDCYNLKDVLTL